jgi:hypothetical protein
MNERMMVIDDMKSIHIPDGELNWMENALQCCALIDYIRKYGLDNITLEDAWIVSDGTFVNLITDKCIILQELPPLKVIYNKETPTNGTPFCSIYESKWMESNIIP